LAKHVPFDEVRGIWQRGGDVLVNGAAFLRFRDEETALFHANALAAIWQLPESSREAAIDAILAEATNRASVNEKVRVYREQSGILRVWCHALFTLLFVVLPASIWVWQVRAHWALLGVAILVTVVGIVVRFYTAHKRLMPEAVAARWKALATMVLLPSSAIRACDILSRKLLATSDPLTIASVLCERESFRSFARFVLLDLGNPSMPVCPTEDHECQQIEQASRNRLVRYVRSLLARQGYHPDELIEPIPSAEAGSISFCVRCDAQYVVHEGICVDCGGIPLRRFPSRSAEPTPVGDGGRIAIMGKKG